MVRATRFFQRFDREARADRLLDGHPQRVFPAMHRGGRAVRHDLTPGDERFLDLLCGPSEYERIGQNYGPLFLDRQRPAYSYQTFDGVGPRNSTTADLLPGSVVTAVNSPQNCLPGACNWPPMRGTLWP